MAWLNLIERFLIFSLESYLCIHSFSHIFKCYSKYFAFSQCQCFELAREVYFFHLLYSEVLRSFQTNQVDSILSYTGRSLILGVVCRSKRHQFWAQRQQLQYQQYTQECCIKKTLSHIKEDRLLRQLVNYPPAPRILCYNCYCGQLELRKKSMSCKISNRY